MAFDVRHARGLLHCDPQWDPKPDRTNPAEQASSENRWNEPSRELSKWENSAEFAGEMAGWPSGGVCREFENRWNEPKDMQDRRDILNQLNEEDFRWKRDGRRLE